MNDLDYLRLLLSSPTISNEEAAKKAGYAVPSGCVKVEVGEPLKLDMLLTYRQTARRQLLLRRV